MDQASARAIDGPSVENAVAEYRASVTVDPERTAGSDNNGERRHISVKRYDRPLSDTGYIIPSRDNATDPGCSSAPVPTCGSGYDLCCW